MFERLQIMEERYEQLGQLLQDPQLTNDIKKYTAIMKEHRSLEKTIEKYREYKALVQTSKELKELANEQDVEIAQMAETELEETQASIDKLIEEIKICLIPRDENDDKNVIVQIKGAAGGDEANIFAADLYRMYAKYAESKGWKLEVTNADETGYGGFSAIDFMINGDAVYSYLKYESGSHRVQRVPETESQGRIHTSTATVLVMPEADDIEVELDMNEVRVDIFCSSGPGGQSVNTTKSAVRVTHLPSGIVVSCQTEKSQIQNREIAMRMLRAKILSDLQAAQEEKIGNERKLKVGTGERSEKIRTYNYPQNRVTDHRISLSVQKLDRIMEGDLDEILDALVHYDQQQKMLGE